MAKIAVPRLDLKRCTRCGECIQSCPESALQYDAQGELEIIPERCTYCGICESSCPEGAVSLAYTISWSNNRS